MNNIINEITTSTEEVSFLSGVRKDDAMSFYLPYRDEKGIIIGLSSGRYLASLFNIERMLPCKVMKIAVNGALIEYNGSFLQDIRISDKAYRMCASFLRGRCSSLMGFTSRRYAIDADDEWFAIQAAMMKQEGVRMDITSRSFERERTLW